MSSPGPTSRPLRPVWTAKISSFKSSPVALALPSEKATPMAYFVHEFKKGKCFPFFGKTNLDKKESCVNLWSGRL